MIFLDTTVQEKNIAFPMDAKPKYLFNYCCF